MVAQNFWITRTRKDYLERGLRRYVESCAEDFREGRYPSEINEETESVMKDAVESAGKLELGPQGHVFELPGSVITVRPSGIDDDGETMGLRVEIDANGLCKYHFGKLMAAMGEHAPRSSNRSITDQLRKSKGPFRSPPASDGYEMI